MEFYEQQEKEENMQRENHKMISGFHNKNVLG